MSIALHRTRGIGIDSSSGLIVGHASLFDSPEFDRSPEGEEAAACSSSESSSIGKNSDASLDGDREEDEEEEDSEVQSSYRGPLDMMDALEEVLPRR